MCFKRLRYRIFLNVLRYTFPLKLVVVCILTQDSTEFAQLQRCCQQFTKIAQSSCSIAEFSQWPNTLNIATNLSFRTGVSRKYDLEILANCCRRKVYIENCCCILIIYLKSYWIKMYKPTDHLFECCSTIFWKLFVLFFKFNKWKVLHLY